MNDDTSLHSLDHDASDSLSYESIRLNLDAALSLGLGPDPASTSDVYAECSEKNELESVDTLIIPIDSTLRSKTSLKDSRPLRDEYQTPEIGQSSCVSCCDAFFRRLIVAFLGCLILLGAVTFGALLLLLVRGKTECTCMARL